MLALSIKRCIQRAPAGLSYVDILIFAAVTDADGSNADAIHLQRDAAAQGYLASLAGDRESQREQNVNFVSGAGGPGRQTADGGAVRFANRDFDGGEFGAIHASEGQQVATVVNHG